MNQPCPQMQDRIADYVLGVLDPRQAEILQEHLAGCEACRQYARSLKDQAKSLVALGSQIEADMQVRQDKVIEALEVVPSAESRTTRMFPLLGGFLRTAIAAVLVLGVGVGLGRWTAPRVDIEQLRADLQASVTASVASTVQESLLGQVDQRVLAGLAKNEAKLRTEVAGQVRDDLQRLVAQAATNSQNLVDQRFDELVQIVEEARLKDRQRVAKALEQIEQNRLHDKAQIGMGLQSLAALTTKATPAVQH
jgi:predicted anti-sigma-YlaC factor YlaD